MNILNLIRNNKKNKKLYVGDIITIKLKSNIKSNKFIILKNYTIISIKKKIFIKILKKIGNDIVRRNIILDSPSIIFIKF
ncbi:hypothetical protein QUR95_00415 [Candidatus Nasuia deltocephalinicola]|nr:hypothetical protein QUR95_00415 [Candidatus Nasuia deltocephalinicola]